MKTKCANTDLWITVKVWRAIAEKPRVFRAESAALKQEGVGANE